jgi:hypothetical protein
LRAKFSKTLCKFGDVQGRVVFGYTPTVKRVGLPFVDNVLHHKRYVREFWNLLSGEKVSTLVYTGQFIDELRMCGYNCSRLQGETSLQRDKRSLEDCEIVRVRKYKITLSPNNILIFNRRFN